MKNIKIRLEEIRKSVEDEDVSYEEIAYLQANVEHIDEDDIVLLEWAGVEELEEAKTFSDLEFSASSVGVGATMIFDNRYGVSVVKHSFSIGADKGLWELAVLQDMGGRNVLVYDTPVADDVLGNLSESDVTEIMRQVQLL